MQGSRSISRRRGPRVKSMPVGAACVPGHHIAARSCHEEGRVIKESGGAAARTGAVAVPDAISLSS